MAQFPACHPALRPTCARHFANRACLSPGGPGTASLASADTPARVALPSRAKAAGLSQAPILRAGSSWKACAVWRPGPDSRPGGCTGRPDSRSVALYDKIPYFTTAAGAHAAALAMQAREEGEVDVRSLQA